MNVNETAANLAATVPAERLVVLEQINQERIAQDNKWGEQDHTPADWLMILGEETGEASEALEAINMSVQQRLFNRLSVAKGKADKAALEAKFSNNPVEFQKKIEEYRTELVQVAAVATSMVEHFDRTYKI